MKRKLSSLFKILRVWLRDGLYLLRDWFKGDDDFPDNPDAVSCESCC